MSLKEALLQIQQEKKEKEIVDKIQSMLDEQNRLLNEGCVNNTTKVKKEWQPDILTKGGIAYYTLNDKKYKVSVCNNDNDVILKYWFKNALGMKVSVSSRTLREAQRVVDDIYGKSKYNLSASKN